nr:DUF5447 family protein [Pseudomonas aeruginosa]
MTASPYYLRQTHAPDCACSVCWSARQDMAPGPDCWKDRSRTYIGIAEAMAEQWGRYVMRALAEPESVSFHPEQQDLLRVLEG